MNRFLSIISLLLCFCMATNAETLTPEQALDRVLGSKDSPAKLRARISAEKSPRLLFAVNTREKAPGCYVFSIDNSGNGFMVVSADDIALPLLGYSDTERFADEAHLPSNLRWWLEFYAEEIAAAADKSPKLSATSVRPQRAPISPLVTTKWDQGSPFNAKCPTVGSSRCVTGCTATALAQVLNYHRWPVGPGKGSKSYKWNNRTLTFDFGNTTFDWDNMLDEYSSTLRPTSPAVNAVATLMYACGVATEMNYGVSASGAYIGNAINTLIDCLGYNINMRLSQRQFYSLLEWEELIYNNLVEYGPVTYSGYTGGYNGDYGDGHEFVCDGYDSDGFFHINWGWGGMSDGYFRLSSLDPSQQGIGGSSSGFNFAQDALLGVCPDRGEEFVPIISLYADSDFKINEESVNLGQNFTFDYTFFSNSNIKLDEVTLGVRLYNEDGFNRCIKSNVYLTNLPPNFGLIDYTCTVAMPARISSGTYTLVPVFTDGSGEWYDVQIPNGLIGRQIVEIQGAKVYFSMPTKVYPVATNIEMSSDIFSDMQFTVEFDLTNHSSEDFTGNIFAVLYNDDQSEVFRGKDMTVSLIPDETLPISMKSVFVGVPNGIYNFAIATTDSSGMYMLMSPLKIEIKDFPTGPFEASIENFRYSGTYNEAQEGVVDVDFTLSCTSGGMDYGIYIAVYNATEWEVITSVSEWDNVITEGHKAKYSYTIPLNKINLSDPYCIFIFFYYENEWHQIYYEPPFSLKFQSGVEIIEEDTEPVSVEYYDLLGRPVDAARSGISIRIATMPDGTRRTTKMVNP